MNLGSPVSEATLTDRQYCLSNALQRPTAPMIHWVLWRRNAPGDTQPAWLSTLAPCGMLLLGFPVPLLPPPSPSSSSLYLTIQWYIPFGDLLIALHPSSISLGFTISQGVKKAVNQTGYLGVFTGSITAAAAGVTAALVFASAASLFAKSADKA